MECLLPDSVIRVYILQCLLPSRVFKIHSVVVRLAGASFPYPIRPRCPAFQIPFPQIQYFPQIIHPGRVPQYFQGTVAIAKQFGFRSPVLFRDTFTQKTDCLGINLCHAHSVHPHSLQAGQYLPEMAFFPAASPVSFRFQDQIPFFQGQHSPLKGSLPQPGHRQLHSFRQYGVQFFPPCPFQASDLNPHTEIELPLQPLPHRFSAAGFSSVSAAVLP